MTLEELRAELDAVDKTIEESFVRRMDIVADIGELKRASSLATLDPKREAEVLRKHSESVPAEYREYTKKLFTELMALSRAFQDSRRADK